MKKAGVVSLLGFVIILSSWWFISSGSQAQPSEGVVDVWATWGDDSSQLQALFDRFSQSSSIPVKVTTQVGSDELLQSLESAEPPDLVILSSSDLIGAYNDRGLVDPLGHWIASTGIALDDIYPAPRAQCTGPEGRQLCLPWGCDVDALFWNKNLFRAAGLDPERPPQTMEEMVEYAARLTVRDKEGELEQVGFIPDFARPHTELYVRMFGGTLWDDGSARLQVDSQPVLDALAWQRQFVVDHGPEELENFVSAFTPYWTSRHAPYAGERISCPQCHRASPIQNGKTPDTGFGQGRIAMMIAGQWQAGLEGLSQDGGKVDYGVAPVPPPAGYPERANTAVVQGPVVFIPAGSVDKEMAADLLAWMMSPEIVAEEALATASLPASRTAAEDPRFDQVPFFAVFMDLLAGPNARPAITTPVNQELNEALSQVEEKLLRGGGEPVLLLREAQAGLAPGLEETTSYEGKP
jgi:multiple sugar transport system substrate-binding protein